MTYMARKTYDTADDLEARADWDEAAAAARAAGYAELVAALEPAPGAGWLAIDRQRRTLAAAIRNGAEIG